MSPNKILKLFCLIILLAAMRAQGGDFILGIYGVNNPKDLSKIKTAGFNVVQTYDKSAQGIAAIAREAQKQGLKILVYPNNIIGSKYVKEAQNWPVYAWYIIDEPDLFNTPYQKLKAKDEAAKAAFPQHNTAFVLSEGFPPINYYKACDIVMVDWYPVPHLPLESLGREISKAGAGMAGEGLFKKPLIAVVQAFDWKDFKQYRPDNDRIGRYPTAQEINFMSYHSILSGATGLFYFSYSEAAKTPAKWQAVTDTVKQLKYLSPVLTRGKELGAPTFIKYPLMAKHIAYNGARYMIAVNASNKPVPAPKQLLSSKYQTLFNARPFAFTVKQNGGNIPPYSVFILKD